MAKLWSLDFNYCQNNRAQWENLRAFLKLLDTKTGYLLFLYIFLFFVLCVYLSVFSVNKFLLTTVNKTFHNLTLLIFFLHAETAPQKNSSGGRCSVDVLQIFGGVSVGVILIKLQSGFFEIALLRCFSPCGFASCLGSTFLEQHLWQTASERR